MEERFGTESVYSATDAGSGSGLRARYLLVVGFLTTLLFTTRLPYAPNQYGILGQIHVGPAVVTVSDIYLGLVVVGLVWYHKRVVISMSVTLGSVAGIILVGTLSMLVNTGLTVEAVVELLQWAEMGVLMIVVALLVRTREEVGNLLRWFVLLASVKASMTVCYYLWFGYPNRRFDAVFEGAGLVVIVAIILIDEIDLTRIALFVLLSYSTFIALSRKVWVGVIIACFCVVVPALFREQWSRHSLRRMATGAAILVTAGVIIFLMIPSNTIWRLGTLVSLVPGLGDISQFERLYVYRTSLNMAIQNPLLGVGPDNFHAAKPMYITDGLARYERLTGNNVGNHNLILKVASEMGFVALGLFVVLLLYPVRFLSGCVLSKSGSEPPVLPLWGLFVFMTVVTSLKGSGFLTRGMLFFTLGVFLSFSLTGPFDD